MNQIPSFGRLRSPSSFYFVRHGESVSNIDARIQGHTESPLSDAGREHAAAAGKWFADKSIDVVFTSPLSRSRETADIIVGATSANGSVTLPDLIEIDTGAFTGMSLTEAAEQDPKVYGEFQVHSWEAVPRAESVKALSRRARNVWSRLINEANSGRQNLLCVTHGGMLQWLIKVTLGRDPIEWMPIFPTANGGIFHFFAQPNGDGGYFGTWEKMNLIPYNESEAPNSGMADLAGPTNGSPSRGPQPR